MCTGSCKWTLTGGKWVCTGSCGGGCACVDAISSLVQVIDSATGTLITTSVKAFIKSSGTISKYIVDPAQMDTSLKSLLKLKGSSKWTDLDDPVKGNPAATALITAAAPIAEAVANAIAKKAPLPAIAGPITLPCVLPT